MRTDTKTFAKTVYNAVRALGATCEKSRDLSYQITEGIRNGAHTMMGRTAAYREISSLKLKLNMNIGNSQPQTVEVHINGEFEFGATTRSRVIFSTEATDRQIELAAEMENARKAVNAASADACLAWEAIHGYPQDNAAAEQRYEDVRKDAAYLDAVAAYEALRDESLSINKYAPAHIVDTRLYSSFSDWYKETTGFRPGIAWTCEMIHNWMAREEASYDQPESIAA